LLDWTDVLILNETQAVTNFVEQLAPLFSHRFYRIVSP